MQQTTHEHARDRRTSPLRTRLGLAGASALTAALAVTATTPAANAAPASSAPSAAAERTDTERKAQKTKKKRPTLRQVTNRRSRRALNIARAQFGDPYRYGATGPGAFDCSGLVRFSFARAGFRAIPRTSSAQARFARRIPRHAMRPGDLVFFTGSGGVYHVGIFARWDRGRRVIVHAPSTGRRVHAAPIWTGSWFAGTLRRG